MSDEGTKGTAWKWDAKRERAALLLADGLTYAEIEAKHGIAHSSIARWKKEPEFIARIEAHIDEAVGEARRVLRRNAAAAAKTIVELSVWGLPGHTTRLAAAKDVLDRAGLKPVQEVKQENSGDLTIRVQYVDEQDG